MIGRQVAAAIETASTLEDLKQRSQELEAALIELERTQATLEKRVAERTSEIQAQKQHFEALVLNSPIAIVMLDLDHNAVACNPAFENLFAAGSILAHPDWMRQKCGAGLAIATAYGAVKAFGEKVKK